MFFVLFNVAFLLLLKQMYKIVWLVALLELDILHFLDRASAL